MKISGHETTQYSLFYVACLSGPKMQYLCRQAPSSIHNAPNACGEDALFPYNRMSTRILSVYPWDLPMFTASAYPKFRFLAYLYLPSEMYSLYTPVQISATALSSVLYAHLNSHNPHYYSVPPPPHPPPQPPYPPLPSHQPTSPPPHTPSGLSPHS